MTAPSAPVADSTVTTAIPAGTPVADRVRAQLERDYPPGALDWVTSLKWAPGPVQVPLAQIDRTAGDWSAGDDKIKVQRFTKRLRAGWKKPVVLIRTPGGGRLYAVDGHTRILGCAALGVPVTAYVGTASTAAGGWTKTHHRQL